MVVDHFHAIKLANTAIDDVRRRVQQDTTGHRGRSGDPLYGIRRTLLRGHERLTARAFDRLLTGLDTGDAGQQVARTWIGKEELRRVYAAHDLPDARRRLTAFYLHCAFADVAELHRLARTIPPGKTRSWPTSPPGRPRTDAPKRPTCSSNGPHESGSDSAPSPTTGSVSYSAAGSPGTLTERPRSEAAHHAWLRRAPYAPRELARVLHGRQI
jgi:hypothetical protein